MEVSEYNKGRTLSDISDKTWPDGTRHNLRPDTIWADERYAKITQKEIFEAQKRVAAREAEKAKHHKKHDDHHGKPDDHHGEHHYDHKHVATKTPRVLYP